MDPDNTENKRDSCRSEFIPYGKQCVSEDDIRAVVEVLRSDWLTTGPVVRQFEEKLAKLSGSRHAVAVNSGTAALHAAMFALDVGPNDEVILPTMTFAATASAVLYQQAIPIFADVRADNLLIDAEKVEELITSRTKAIVAVDYAGHPCDYDGLRTIAARHGLPLVADACHAAGGSYKGKTVGSLAELNTFSFHPVKNLTTGEGGAITTDNDHLAERMRSFRNHCISADHHKRQAQGSWFYEIAELGYNYRITDIQCALGNSQLDKVHAWVARRQEIAAHYAQELSGIAGVSPLSISDDVSHAFHLYVVRFDTQLYDRAAIFVFLREQGLGVNVHYIPVHYHPLYRQRFNTTWGICPIAEAAYEEIISLPIFPGMSQQDVRRVADTVEAACSLPEARR